MNWSKSYSGEKANKGTRRMPRQQQPMKDVISCDKPGGDAHDQRSPDFRMGKPACLEDMRENGKPAN